MKYSTPYFESYVYEDKSISYNVIKLKSHRLDSRVSYDLRRSIDFYFDLGLDHLQGGKYTCLDLSKVKIIDSVGIRAILDFHQRNYDSGFNSKDNLSSKSNIVGCKQNIAALLKMFDDGSKFNFLRNLNEL
jgi:hypothetical protein